jgi:hypothetical protein
MCWPEVVVFKRLSGLNLAMSQTRDIQTTPKALKQQNDIATLPSSSQEELGNVATKLGFARPRLLHAERDRG